MTTTADKNRFHLGAKIQNKIKYQKSILNWMLQIDTLIIFPLYQLL